ncbi:YdaU family protein [Burkholderia glumae]|uniref:YdaU family protein n=1 Tax=Burkholderia glumae TaxID=337 RepID=UPI002036A5F8|nr:YdaU family protein [Burkholderia glumae]MCM2546174.1 YdaU family protein [Burkholderia glumae]
MHQYLHHIGDFRSGTYSMTRLQRAIYRELLDVYYDKEKPLPLDVAAVCQLVGAFEDAEREIVEWLLRFKFEKTDDGYVHDVCERVIAEYRAKADVARENGKAGGRPRKPRGNPEKPSGLFQEPSGNPEQTGSKANHKPITNNHKPEEPKTQRAPRFDAQAHLVSLSVDPQVADDWLKLRKGKRLASTETAFAGVQAEAQKAGLSLDAALRICCMRGWGGFDASWLARDAPRQQRPPNWTEQNAATIANLTGQNRHAQPDERIIDV